jgi:ribosomal-protein-serine acetyltransferase
MELRTLPAVPFLPHDLGDGAELVLRDLSTVSELHRLTVSNLDRLRRWENWAHREQTEEAVRAYTSRQLAALADGRALPMAIRLDGRLVGSVGARIASEVCIAELGYWVDAPVEGRGLVTRSVTAVLGHLAEERDVRRFEIRTAASNRRSRAVAERCGFTLEGVLESAFPVAGERHDAALYSRLV